MISYVTVTSCSLGQVEYSKEEAHHKVSLGGHGRCIWGGGWDRFDFSYVILRCAVRKLVMGRLTKCPKRLIIFVLPSADRLKSCSDFVATL
jgi:hypothetical protein